MGAEYSEVIGAICHSSKLTVKLFGTFLDSFFKSHTLKKTQAWALAVPCTGLATQSKPSPFLAYREALLMPISQGCPKTPGSDDVCGNFLEAKH